MTGRRIDDGTGGSPPTLTLAGLTVRHGNRRLFAPVHLTVRPGETATVLGPSGVGKSSLLAAIAGTLPAGLSAEGSIRLGARSLDRVPAHRRGIAMVFQDDLLFPHLSVGGNLAFGLPPGLSRSDRRARIADALASAELAGFADRDPATLSGGQRARVALLRALLSLPKALLLDEPFSRLDADLRGHIRDFVAQRVAEAGLPTLLVTHDISDTLPGKIHRMDGPPMSEEPSAR